MPTSTGRKESGLGSALEGLTEGFIAGERIRQSREQLRMEQEKLKLLGKHYDIQEQEESNRTGLIYSKLLADQAWRGSEQQRKTQEHKDKLGIEEKKLGVMTSEAASKKQYRTDMVQKYTDLYNLRKQQDTNRYNGGVAKNAVDISLNVMKQIGEIAKMDITNDQKMIMLDQISDQYPAMLKQAGITDEKDIDAYDDIIRAGIGDLSKSLEAEDAEDDGKGIFDTIKGLFGGGDKEDDTEATTMPENETSTPTTAMDEMQPELPPDQTATPEEAEEWQGALSPEAANEPVPEGAPQAIPADFEEILASLQEAGVEVGSWLEKWLADYQKGVFKSDEEATQALLTLAAAAKKKSQSTK